MPRDAEAYFAGMGWRLEDEGDYVSIAEQHMAPGMQASLASALQLDVSHSDLREYFRFFRLTRTGSWSGDAAAW